MTASSSRRGRGLKTLLLAAALSAGLHTGTTLAQTAPAPQTIDIPAGSLAQALDRLGEQTGVLITYEPGLVQGLNAPRVSGQFPPGEALRRLLSGSGIRAEAVNERTFVLRRAPATKEDAANAAAARSAAAAAETEMEAVVVTGSRLSRTSVEGPVPVNVYMREEIERSGQTTVSDFLNTLAEVSVATPENGPVFAGQTSVRLRGLPLGTTLVLVNGRRLQNGGASAGYGSYFDLNNIPAGAIERIEIVPEGSSAIYGSDALAGVVNIILRKDFDGFEGNARYGAASGIDEASADFVWGRTGERGSFSAIGSYFTRGTLNAREREITSSSALGTPTDACNPGNVYSVDGGNLPGLDAPSAGVRAGIHETPTLDAFVPGQTNPCSLSYDRGLIPPTRRFSVFASGSYRIAPWIELFSELAYTRQEQDVDNNGHRRLQRVRVPASNAYNPFGADVLVSYRFESPLANIMYHSSTDFTRPLLGARGDFLDGWDWELAVWEARDRSNIHQGATLVDSANLQAALASSNPDTALNLFTTGAPASDSVLASIYGVNRARYSGRSRVANGFVRGSPFTLPSGPVSIVLGAEHVRSELTWESADNPAATSNFSHARKASSVFSELRIPILASRPGADGADVLAFSGALRYDSYDDIGGHSTPQYALEWRPLKTLLVRGAYAESFKAPGLLNLHYPESAFADCCEVFDPQQGGAATTYTFIRRGDPELRPETGDSRSVGVVWSPEAIQGLEASLTWWKINQTDRVAELTPQTVVDNESLFPGRVVRDPETGAIRSVSPGFLNFGQLHVSGFDLGLSHRIHTGAGLFSPRLSVTRIGTYDAAVTPGAAVTDRLSKANTDAWAPRWKGVASLAWSFGPYSANFAGRYVSRYTDYQDLGATSRQLGDFWLFDVSTRYDFGQVFAGNNPYLRDAFLQLSVVNLFNSLPEYSAYNGGSASYDPMQYDIRGRFISASLGVRF